MTPTPKPAIRRIPLSAAVRARLAAEADAAYCKARREKYGAHRSQGKQSPRPAYSPERLAARLAELKSANRLRAAAGRALMGAA